MRKRAIFPVAAAAVMLMMIGTAAEAKNRDGAIEVGLMANYFDTDQFRSDEIEPLEKSAGVSFRFGYHFSAALEVEFLGTFQPTENVSKTRDVDVIRALILITGNFLTDRDIRTVPYVSAGLGVIQETREAFTPPGGGPEVNEAFDSSAVLTIGVGGRTFLTDNFDVRYEVRYAHHDSFDELQDEFISSVGITWVVGGHN